MTDFSRDEPNEGDSDQAPIPASTETGDARCRDRLLSCETARKCTRAWSNETPLHRIALVLVFICGLGLRISFLFQPLRLDEASSYVELASHPVSLGLSYYPHPNNHLLNTLFMNLSTRLFGGAEWAIRLPALLFGVLLLPAAYVVIRRLLGRNPALLTVTFLAFAPVMVTFSTDGRGYTLQVLLFLLLVWYSLEMKEKGINAPRAIAFCLLSILSFYDIPTTLYFWVGLVAWLVLSALVGDTRDGRRRFIGLLGAMCAATIAGAVLAYLPVVFRMGAKALIANEWVRPRKWSWFLTNARIDFKGLWSSWNISLPIVISVLLAAGFLIAVIFFRRICRHRVNLPIVMAVCCVVLVFAQRVNPFPRVWLPLMPFYLGFSFAGLIYGAGYLAKVFKLGSDRVSDISPNIPDVLAMVVLALFTTLVLVSQSAYQITDSGELLPGPSVRSVIQTVSRHMGKKDLLCVDSWTAPLYQYYYERLGLPMRQFAPNKRIDAEVREIRDPERYIVLYDELNPNTKLLADDTAKKRGLTTDNLLLGDIKLGSYHAYFVQNAAPK